MNQRFHSALDGRLGQASESLASQPGGAGDFNIDRQDDPLYRAFTSTGLTVPAALNSVRRSIFADPGQPTLSKYYDQIAWFTQGRAQLINMQLLSAGGVDFVDHLYRDVGMTKAQMQYRVSDHYPLWVEFGQ
jgi:hypothetical protein